MSISKLFFKQVDISPLIVFRILFGFLMVAECWGAIATGWVKETFVDPEFTFTFMGFEWTRFLLGKTMYGYFFVMGIFAWGVTLGYRYRLSSILLTIMWGLVYFMQKSHYNNHYYFIVIIATLMCLVPANSYYSLDVKQKRVQEKATCASWCLWVFAAEITILYFYAAIAKIYPGWINGDFIAVKYQAQASWFENTLGWDSFAELLRNKSLQEFIVWAGIFFDLLIVPLLLWKKTRTPALLLTFIFHLSNSITLHVGIFPYFALSFALFFYPPETIRQIFFKRKPIITHHPIAHYQPWTVSFICLILIIHTLLPLRHYFIQDDVFWTEEGHRMSWRMMLRAKSGHTTFTMVDAKGKRSILNPTDYITPRQAAVMQVKPDMIWQFVQYVKEKKAEEGLDSIQIFAKGKLSLNRGPYYSFIYDTVDLTQVQWNSFKHETWLRPSPTNFNNWNQTKKLRR